ncbi:uncharacterized protein LOC118411706 [Branchiostoma floridae]|uniref:Uncharacterized protein LOC118411706 n=1 Tax=Branchiostoma floridae TaxID=7739 RepID=A0A9J7KV05_BRAFL|nr:uncharacterized protein LOC118411706 [Branchiostoma floridae]
MAQMSPSPCAFLFILLAYPLILLESASNDIIITYKQCYAVTAQSTYTRKALTGSEVTLPCDYDQTVHGDWFLVTWSVLIGGTFQNLYVGSPGSTGNSVTPPAQFAGRLAIDGISNLRLTGVTIADEDEYRCIVTAQTSPTTLVNLHVFHQPPTAPIVQAQFDPPTSSIFEVPLNTAVTFTCTSTGGRPPASLRWTVTESGTPVSVNPTYTSSNNSQGVGDATSTFNFTITKYGVTYRVQCTASGPDPIQDRRTPVTSLTTEKGPDPTQSRTSAVTSFTTEPDYFIPTTPKGQTGVVTSSHTPSNSPGPDVSKTPQTEASCAGPRVLAGAAVGCFIGGLLVGGAAVFLFLRYRTEKNGGKKKDVGAEKQYENVVPSSMSRAASQRPGNGSDDYEVPMETIQTSSQPPQPTGDYQEPRPAIYQSLQKPRMDRFHSPAHLRHNVEMRHKNTIDI